MTAPVDAAQTVGAPNALVAVSAITRNFPAHAFETGNVLADGLLVSSVVNARHVSGRVELWVVALVHRYQRMLSVGVGVPAHVPATAVTLPLEDGMVGLTPLVVVNLGATELAGALPTAIGVEAEYMAVFGAPLTGVTLTVRKRPMSADFATYCVGETTVVA